ncbi:MAG: hypothetical protein E3J21_05080 [Anaerolineales bacterium]|nr:MAG: hypothetical protein E3J21_05080 [Anaerolineales bacterium]
MSEKETIKQAEREAVRRRMAIRHGVDQTTNTLILRMRELVDDTNVVNSRMEKHQIGNVLAVALETPSVELVKNFVLYQAGRDVSGTSWRKANFGEKLVRELDDLHEEAEGIAHEVSRQLRAGQPEERDIDEVWIEMVRQYLGQLNRYFYYRKEAGRWSKS